MKKLILTVALGLASAGVFAQQAAAPRAEQASTPKEAAQTQASAPQEKEETSKQTLSQEEQYKRFQARNAEIRKLTKAYRKASATQKPVIKKRLAQIVSEATDESIAWSKERIAAERANLDQWEKTLQEREGNLEQVKAQRVDDILSGEAERRHKLAQKRWKQEMKDRKKYMK